MHTDEPSPPSGRGLSPEEVGARVSAILEAAERDARAVIAAAHQEVAAPPPPRTLEELAGELADLRARVEALEKELRERAAATPTAPAQRRERSGAVDPAARVRAIELALAGYSRDAIARELGTSMAPGDVEGLLDEVLAR